MLSLKIKRTANAGVLLTMDGSRILLDGVCEKLHPYLGTPSAIRDELIENMPDILAFTHRHKDHYDDSYAQLYREKTLRFVYEPESLPIQENIGNIRITPVQTRHIGKTDVPHISYIIEGSSCVWFMGDASPLNLKKFTELPRPDILIVPFAYAITESAWKKTRELGAKEIIILHMPHREDDGEGVWRLLDGTIEKNTNIHIPEIAEELTLSI